MSTFIDRDYPRRDGWRRAVVLLAALVSAGVTARAGFWQLDRAAQKEQIEAVRQQRADLPVLGARELATDAAGAAQQLHRSVVLGGAWIPGSTVFLDNRQMNGRPGFYVVSALRLPDGPRAVLVQRGWVPRDPVDRERLPVVATDADPVEVIGRVAPPPARLYQFGEAGSGSIRQNLDLESFSREIGVALLPMSIQQTGPTGSAQELKRDWPKPAVDIHKHYGYAVQWFALSGLIAGLYVWFQVLRPRRRR